MCNTPTLKPTDHLEKSQSHCSSGNAWVPLYFKGWNLNLNVTMVRGWDFWKNLRVEGSALTDESVLCRRDWPICLLPAWCYNIPRKHCLWGMGQTASQLGGHNFRFPTSRIVRQQFLFFKNYLFSLGVVLNVYKPSTWGRLRIQGQPGKTLSLRRTLPSVSIFSEWRKQTETKPK